MTDVTNEEHLRLARKAWPGDDIAAVVPWAGKVVTVHGEHIMSINHRNAPLAMHAALLVLAGELDVSAALAAQTKLETVRKYVRAIVDTSQRSKEVSLVLERVWALLEGT